MVCCSMLQRVAVWHKVLQRGETRDASDKLSTLIAVSVCGILQCVEVCCSVLQCVAVC